ncbi:MAG: glucoamylase [Candidatus Thermoplasmatota archaeon]
MISFEKAEKIYQGSIKVLKKVQLKNGGCIATPEDERYPYVYPRDHAMITRAFISAGLYNRAKKALDFVFSTKTDKNAFPQRIDTNGEDASYKPVQIDGTGLTLYTFCNYIEETADYDFGLKYFSRARKAADYIIDSFYENVEGKYEKRKHNLKMPLVYTPNSIHEYPPTEKGLEIWANCTCCAGLNSLSEISKRIGQVNKKYRSYAKKIHKGILNHMWNPRLNSFIKTIRVRESSSVLLDPDVGEYGIAEFGLLKDDDKRVVSTVSNIEKNLWNKDLGGICRYPKYEGRNNGGWGPWPNYTLMLCRHYIRRGNQDKADKYLKWVLDISYDNLLPEHVSTVDEFEEYVSDFKRAGLIREDREKMIENARSHPMFDEGIAYITLPLAWSHAEFIMTFNLYKKRFDGD